MIEVRKVYIHDGRHLWFSPVDNTPGFTHRVILDDRAVDWLAATCRPSRETAAFYFDKHKQQGAA